VARRVRTPVPERIAVRLPNWLGDTVMAMPALRALREARPDARVLVAGPWSQMLVDQDVADELLPYPRTWSERGHAARGVRAFAPDLALLLPNSLEAALSARFWCASLRVGFATGGRGWLLTDALRLPQPRAHQVDEYASLVEHLGVRVASREPALRRPDAAGERSGQARALLEDVGAPLDGDGPVVAVHLAAAYGSSKVWPAQRVIELVQALRTCAAVVLLGPATSADVARTIMATVPVPCLVGRDSPVLLSAVLAHVDVLVGGDTGVTHLAAALGTPVVALFGPTDPARTAPRGRSVIVSRAVPCAPCFYRECPIEHPCMRDIQASEVAAHVLRLVRRPVTTP
jgi:lipopolysaccharide heptosyltransferase II